MSQENGTATVSAAPPPSPPDVDVQDSSKRSKISYTREFLLSLSKADSCNAVKLPKEVQLSISCVFQDSPGILSPPTCVPDSGFQKSMPQKISPKVMDIDSANHQLHRTIEPYRPPCRNKALPPSTRDSNVLLNTDSSGSSEGSVQEKTELETWRKEKSCADIVKEVEEDKEHSIQNIDSKDRSEEFLMSPATRNSNTLQLISNIVINEQLDASLKLSLIEGAVRGNAVSPSTLPETTKSCSTQRQQDLSTDKTVNPWQSSGNHIYTSCHLSMLDNDHLIKSEECLNFDVEHPVGPCNVMESVKISRPTSLHNQENCGNLKKTLCQLANEQGTMESQLSNVSLQDVKQEIPVIPTQNRTNPDLQRLGELELNCFYNSLDGESNSRSEVCWPDEDSLIAFDGPFLMQEVENSAAGDTFMSNPERSPNKADGFSPRSPREMIEKLLESVLNDDDSTPAPYFDDPIVHHGAGTGFYPPMHAQQPYPQLCSSQLNPRWGQQSHNSFQENFIGSPTFSLFSYPSPSNSISPPFLLCQDDMRRFDHEVSQSRFQQMINPISSMFESQSGVPVPPHLPAPRMTSCTQKLNSMQGCSGYQESSLDLHGDSARHWNPYIGGF